MPKQNSAAPLATGALAVPAAELSPGLDFLLHFFIKKKVEEEQRNSFQPKQHDSAHSRATLHAIALQQASTPKQDEHDNRNYPVPGCKAKSPPHTAPLTRNINTNPSFFNLPARIIAKRFFPRHPR